MRLPLFAFVMLGLSMMLAKSIHAQEGTDLSLFLCGDVMLGRGVDQILPHPSDPVIHESYMKSALGYVDIAERHSGPLPRDVPYTYVWGEALKVLNRIQPDLRIINLETSITRSNAYWKGKGINYRMHPENTPCLTAAQIDFCSLANNHVLDWGYEGLAETIECLKSAGIRSAGAGQSQDEASRPAVFTWKDGIRILIYAYGMPNAGVPPSWKSKGERPGVNHLPDYSADSFLKVKNQIMQHCRPGDLIVVSVHWGSNWGYQVSKDQRRFAHRLVEEAGVDLIHGHSSHHVRPMEVFRDRLILYGCGDFLNDYEGIGGHENYRSDLSLMYFVRLEPGTGRLAGLTMVPMQIHRLRLRRACRADAEWLSNTLNREGRPFGTSLQLTGDKLLELQGR